MCLRIDELSAKWGCICAPSFRWAACEFQRERGLAVCHCHKRRRTDDPKELSREPPRHAASSTSSSWSWSVSKKQQQQHASNRTSVALSLLAPQSSTRAPSLLGARVFERAPSCGSRSTSSRFETRASRREALSGAPQVSAWIVCEPTTTNHSSSHVLPLDQSISSLAASGSRRHSLTLSLSSLLRASIFEGERERCDCCCCWGRYLRGSGYWPILIEREAPFRHLGHPNHPNLPKPPQTSRERLCSTHATTH